MAELAARQRLGHLADEGDHVSDSAAPSRRPANVLVCMSSLFAVTLLTGCLPMMACAAGPQLKLPEFEHLREVATQSVNVSIGGWPLGLAAWVADSDNDPDAAEFRELLHGLKGIYIRSYEFASDNMYPSEDVDTVRAQLSAPDWSPVAQIRSGHRRFGIPKLTPAQ
ncbi:MAG: DUF4252 domain-containing protein [Gammaproteobacteria bacterium]|nr:MAG: DUF4252 domain-containing protein [Gammaproteobacteria bacterium]